MRIAVHLGVLDEASLIEGCIAHMHKIGISEFYVCDLGSTDGTEKFLASLEGPDFHVIHMANAEAGEKWVVENSAFVKQSTADWLLFADADEFFLPATGHLADCLAGAAPGVLAIPRYNVPLTSSGPLIPTDPRPADYNGIQLVAKTQQPFRKYLADNPATPWIMGIPAAKVAVPPGLIGAITPGGHGVLTDGGMQLPKALAKGLIMAHLPLTSLERFRHKIGHIREYFAHQSSYADDTIGWHWRRWIDLADKGLLDEEFSRSVFDDETIAILRADGILKTAAELLQP